jgi:hypothetical protein
MGAGNSNKETSSKRAAIEFRELMKNKVSIFVVATLLIGY